MNWGKARKRRLGILVGMTLLVGGIVAGPMRGGAIPGTAGNLRDPLSLMGDRSPGARGNGKLINTKLGYAPVPHGTNKGSGPVAASRAPIIRDALIPSGAPLAFGPTDTLDRLRTPGLTEFVPGPSYPGGDNFVYPPGGGQGPGGGGGGCPGVSSDPKSPCYQPSKPGDPTNPNDPSNPIDPGKPSPPIVTPVPEPATWAMMIIGIGFVGGAMRRRQAEFAKAGAIA